MNITVIHNAEAGRRRAGGNLARPGEVAGLKATVIAAESWEHCRDVARTAAESGADIVVAAGGDGTVNAVINGIAGHDIALGILPLGTANDLAHELKIPRRLFEAWETILRGACRRVDLIGVNGWRFATCGGIGFPSDVVARLQARRQALRPGRSVPGWETFRYVAAAANHLLTGRPSTYSLAIEREGRMASWSVYSMVVANQRKLGRHFRIAPKANNADGLVDVCIMKNSGSLARFAATVVATLPGLHVDRPDVIMFQTGRIMVQTPHPVAFLGDGERRVVSDTFTVHALPSALRVLCPADQHIGSQPTTSDSGSPRHGVCGG